ncbi:MAG: MBG domain-containing protein [Lachnospiraceae bacterium]
MKKIKMAKVMSVILSLVMVIQLISVSGFSITVSATADITTDYSYDTWSDAVTAVDTAGSGTDYEIDGSGNLTIKTALGLAWFAAEVNGGTTYEDKTVTLADDIDLLEAGVTGYNEATIMADGYEGDNSWTAIGTVDNRFLGTFDGDGHTISHIYINTTTYYQGLFGFVGVYENEVSIKNLGIINSSISGGEYTGGIVGCNYANITNCYNTGAVSGTTDVGGIVGCNLEEIINCYNTGTVSGTGKYTGGIAGYSDGTISKSYNTGVVSGGQYTGGVAGYSYVANNSSDAISNSYNTGNVSGSSGVGGIAGYAHVGIIEYCYNIGAVSGTTDVGGIAGTSVVTITSCYYNSDTSGTSDNTFGTAKTTAQMTGSDALTNMSFNNEIWEATANTATIYYYPVLKDNTQNPVPSITPSTPTLEVSIANWIYGETASSPSVVCSSSSSSSPTVTYTYSDDENGTFKEIVPTNAGTYYVKATVAAEGLYTSAEEVKEFTIEKATPSYTVPNDLTATFGDTLATVTLPTDGDGVFKFEDTSVSVGEAGDNTFSLTYTPNDANYATVTFDVTISVAKATPSYTVPTDLTATYGETLADVTLPTGFTFDDEETTSVGNAGGNSFTVTYTPTDADNYNTVTDITVTIAVGKADPSYTDLTSLIATYGETIANVILPTDFAFDDAETTSVGNVGEHSFTVTYTPTDTENYNTVENIDVTVTVSPKNITITPTAASKYYGQVDSVIAYTFSDEVGSEVASFTGALARATGEETGTYAISLGTLELEDKDSFLADNYNLVLYETTVNYTIKEYTTDATVTESTDWKNTSELTLTAPTDHTISATNGVTVDFAESVTISTTEGEGETATYYLKNTVGGAISTAKTFTYNNDQTAPTATITIEESSWSTFLETITVGTYKADDFEVVVTSDDTLSGVASTEYYITTVAKTLDELKAVEDKDWTTYEAFTITAEDTKNVIVYVKITDNVSNVAYISSDGVVFDTTAPIITGAENNKFYKEALTITATDTNLDSVTVNGEEMESPFTVEAGQDETYTVIATDKAGNTTTIVFTTYKENPPVDDVVDKLPEASGDMTDDEKEIVNNLTEEVVTNTDKETAKDDEEVVETLNKLDEAFVEANTNITVVATTKVVDESIDEDKQSVAAEIIPQGLAIAVYGETLPTENVELSLSISQVSGDEDGLVFDIKPMVSIDGVAAAVISNNEIKAPVTFKIYLNNSFKGNEAKVKHLKSDGTTDVYENLPVKTDDIGKYIVLTVAEFSNFTVSEYEDEVTQDDVTPEDVTPEVATSNNIELVIEGNGTITPDAGSDLIYAVDMWQNVTFTFVPNAGYAVGEVFVDGWSVGTVPSYTFETVDEYHSLKVVFVESDEEVADTTTVPTTPTVTETETDTEVEDTTEVEDEVVEDTTEDTDVEVEVEADAEVETDVEADEEETQVANTQETINSILWIVVAAIALIAVICGAIFIVAKKQRETEEE